MVTAPNRPSAMATQNHPATGMACAAWPPSPPWPSRPRPREKRTEICELLSGRRPDEDIKINFTGARPGEKLYEELNSMDEDTISTPCEKIKIFTGNGVPAAGMEPYLEALRHICKQRDVPDLVLTLKDLIPDYNPGSPLLKLAMSPTVLIWS